jgi:pathogenesis-related protein 1
MDKNRIATLFLILIVTPNLFSQKIVPAKTGSKATQQEAQVALDFHNKVRADVGVSPLIWSVELSAYAQEWAEYLIAKEGGRKIYHRSDILGKRKFIGENIFWVTTTIKGSNYNSLDAVKSWYDEIKYYDYKINDTKEEGKETGHYTQLVWSSTKSVGMGIAKNDWITIIVADYDPPGNWVGQKTY